MLMTTFLPVGPFRIYRAPGSVAFLSCGTALQPILPKSQCWCLDEDNSRFVLQIRRPQYWRIELPVDDPDDAHRALILREVLDNILLFEKTECPFQRSFTVELPESSQTPVKLRPWTSEGKNLISSPFSPLQSPSPSPLTRERRTTLSASNFVAEYERFWRDKKPREVRRGRSISPTTSDAPYIFSDEELAESLAAYAAAHTRPVLETDEQHSTNPKYPKSNIDIKPLQRPTESPVSDDTTSRPSSSMRHGKFKTIAAPMEETEMYDQDVGSAPARKYTTPSRGRSGDGGNEPSSFEGSGHVAPVNLSRKRMTRVLAGRSFTAAPHPANVVTSHPPKSREVQPARVTSTTTSRPRTKESSPGSSTDSFHPVQSWHTPLTPLPPSPPSSRPSTPPTTAFPRLHEDNVVSSREPRPKDASDFTPTPNRKSTLNPSSSTAAASSVNASSALDLHANTPEKPLTPTSVDGEVTNARSSALEERQQPRPRPRPNSLSISRRALSPLPPAANLFSHSQRRPSESNINAMRRLPSTIIQKTLEVFLGPPIFLVKLMLKVAAKILAGEWRGLVFGIGESGEKIPVQWDYSDGEFSDWEDDDDYIFPEYMSNRGDGNLRMSQPNNSGANDTRSWEVD